MIHSKRSHRKHATLSQGLVRIFLIGFIMFFFLIYLLQRYERDRSGEQWELDKISQSASDLTSYYANLVTHILLSNEQQVKDILARAKESENLKNIAFTPQLELSPKVLETCKVNYGRSFYYQTPTCFEQSEGSLRIFHELRSAGHSLGYLVKAIEKPPFRLFADFRSLHYSGIVLLCFIALNGISLWFVRRRIIQPVRYLVGSLRKKGGVNPHDPALKYAEIKTLARSLRDSMSTAKRSNQRAQRLEYEAKVGQLTSQVAHDIRSPLAALNVVVANLDSVQEDQRVLIRSAVQSIEDIANDLDVDYPSRSEGVGTESKRSCVECATLVAAVARSVASEKRTEFRGKDGFEIVVDVAPGSHLLFAAIDATVFRRCLYNLINNAFEAFNSDGGKVVISVDQAGQHLRVCISDNGRGMPDDVLRSVTKRGYTHGKKNGSGLGLYYVNRSLKQARGALKIESKLQEGTRVTMILPVSEAPDWFANEIIIHEETDWLVLDDEPAVHHVWQKRSKQVGIKLEKLHHFNHSSELYGWFAGRQRPIADRLLLCDFELMHDRENGLEVIARMQEECRAILVTNRYKEPGIRMECLKAGIRILPKDLAAYVPIHKIEPTNERWQPLMGPSA